MTGQRRAIRVEEPSLGAHVRFSQAARSASHLRQRNIPPSPSRLAVAGLVDPVDQAGASADVEQGGGALARDRQEVARLDIDREVGGVAVDRGRRPWSQFDVDEAAGCRSGRSSVPPRGGAGIRRVPHRPRSPGSGRARRRRRPRRWSRGRSPGAVAPTGSARPRRRRRSGREACRRCGRCRSTVDRRC